MVKTYETKHLLSIYQALIESDLDDNTRYKCLSNVDDIAELILTFSEFKQYHENTMKMLKDEVQ